MIERVFVSEWSNPMSAPMRQADRSGWSNAALSAEVLEFAAVVERAQAELVRVVGVWNARAAWADDGAQSAAGWLAARTPMTRPAAARLVRTARLANDHEQTAKALEVGDVTVAHVETLAAVSRGREELYAEHEDTLLNAAGALVPDDLVDVARRWRELADDELARIDAAASFERRNLHVSPTIGGGVIGGFLDPEDTATFIAVLDAQEPPDPTDGDLAPRSLSQRRADALMMLCRSSSPSDDSGAVRLVSTSVDVVIDHDTLTGDRTGSGARMPMDLFAIRSEILGHGPLAKCAVERLLCDSEVGRVIMRGKSEVLDLGRRSRLPNRALRRAVARRDRHCQFPGCRVPARWCDVHHVVHWVKGGETNEVNCVLLCRRHHVLTHEGGWSLHRAADGTVTAEPASASSGDTRIRSARVRPAPTRTRTSRSRPTGTRAGRARPAGGGRGPPNRSG